MLKKMKHARKYLLYVILTNIIFGLIYYLVFSWLVKHSLQHAYLGCLVLIFMGLYLDNYLLKSLTSKKTVMEIQHMKAEDKEKNYRLIQRILDSFVSFKTILFVFYFFILVASQILNIKPTLVNEDMKNFITANSYGIVLLLAWDRIIGQFSRDRKDMKEKAELLGKSMQEDLRKL